MMTIKEFQDELASRVRISKREEGYDEKSITRWEADVNCGQNSTFDKVWDHLKPHKSYDHSLCESDKQDRNYFEINQEDIAKEFDNYSRKKYVDYLRNAGGSTKDAVDNILSKWAKDFEQTNKEGLCIFTRPLPPTYIE